MTPLHWFFWKKLCSSGGTDIVQLLISHGADVSARDKMGNSPLMYAVAESKIPTGVLRMLFDHAGQNTDLSQVFSYVDTSQDAKNEHFKAISFMNGRPLFFQILSHWHEFDVQDMLERDPSLAHLRGPAANLIGNVTALHVACKNNLVRESLQSFK